MTEIMRPHVVIVGGGFAGLAAAKRLRKRRDVRVTIIDRHNYHLFQPLLYQVAMAGLSSGDIATPIRMIFSRDPNIQVLLGEVIDIQASAKFITTDFGKVEFDYLILGCGSEQSYFGHEEWESFAPGLKTLEQATEVRRRVLLAFELAERETDPEKTRALLSFVVVGGGPTGVELAGALGEISRFTLSRDFRHIDPRRTRIILIEAGPRILPSFSEDLSHQTVKDLENLGVTVWTSIRVSQIDAEGVNLGKEHLKASTVLWAAGVRSSPLNAKFGVPLDRGGRVLVEPDLSVPGFPNVFIAGDQASVVQNGKPVPGLAPAAMQMGRTAADNILSLIDKKMTSPFQYWDKGQIATIGRRKAVLQMGKLKLSGILAWDAWLFIHIFYLIGFKNRLLVMIQWAWSYFTYKRGAQLIVSKQWRSFPDSRKKVGGPEHES